MSAGCGIGSHCKLVGRGNFDTGIGLAHAMDRSGLDTIEIVFTFDNQGGVKWILEYMAKLPW